MFGAGSDLQHAAFLVGADFLFSKASECVCFFGGCEGSKGPRLLLVEDKTFKTQ